MNDEVCLSELSKVLEHLKSYSEYCQNDISRLERVINALKLTIIQDDLLREKN